MSAAPTPGEWQMVGSEDDICIFVPNGIVGIIEICNRVGGRVLGDKHADYSEIEANARMIYAAKDLAAALKALHRQYNDRKGIPYALDQQVRSALAKAGL